MGQAAGANMSAHRPSSPALEVAYKVHFVAHPHDCLPAAMVFSDAACVGA